MRILWLGHNLAFPPKGGVLQRNYNLLREAAKICEVHVLAFDQPGTRSPGISLEDCVRALGKFCAGVEGVPLSRGLLRTNRYWVPLRTLVSPDPFDFHWLQSSEMTERLKKILESVRFDVIHFDTLGLAQYRPFVSGCGAVLNHHNVESSMMGRRASRETNLLRRQYWCTESRRLRGAEKRWCPRFEVNLVVSPEDEELLTASVPGIGTVVVPNGVDVDYFTPRPDPGRRRLLFCGGLDWYPNREAMHFFFDAIWPRLIASVEEIEVYVVGRKPPRWLRSLSLSDERIHVPGFVEDVRPYFRQATAYVCPINNGGGTRLKILDALAMGVPVVATSFACSGLSLQEGKHVLLAETPEQFVYQIGRLLSNPAMRVSLAMTGRQVVEQLYSWRVIGQGLIRAYEIASRPWCAVNMS